MRWLSGVRAVSGAATTHQDLPIGAAAPGVNQRPTTSLRVASNRTAFIVQTCTSLLNIQVLQITASRCSCEGAAPDSVRCRAMLHVCRRCESSHISQPYAQAPASRQASRLVSHSSIGFQSRSSTKGFENRAWPHMRRLPCVRSCRALAATHPDRPVLEPKHMPCRVPAPKTLQARRRRPVPRW